MSDGLKPVIMTHLAKKELGHEQCTYEHQPQNPIR